jgi:flagellar biosynthesis/type III secretory pathway M-ring protein FliF/YscJ
MGYYDNILNLISVVLALSILFIIIFGCQFKKYRHLERFTNAEDEKKEEKPKNDELPPFEKNIYNKLKDGSLKDEEMQDLIDKDIFKRENLEKMLNYIEKFKNKDSNNP